MLLYYFGGARQVVESFSLLCLSLMENLLYLSLDSCLSLTNPPASEVTQQPGRLSLQELNTDTAEQGQTEN